MMAKKKNQRGKVRGQRPAKAGEKRCTSISEAGYCLGVHLESKQVPREPRLQQASARPAPPLLPSTFSG